MKLKIRTTLFGAIAALIAGPTWATSHTAKDGAYTPPPTKAESGQSERGQSERGQPTAAQPISETPPRMGQADHGTTVRSSIGDNPLYARSAAELEGVEVVDSTGDKVGDVKKVVLAPDRMSAYAVITAGGVSGMGEREIMISLDDLLPIDDKMQVSTTKEEAMALNDDVPDADEYVEMKGDMPLSESVVEFSALEKVTETKPGPASMTPKADADKPTHPAVTPNVGAEKPATAPATPRVLQ